ncbi:Receptor-type tyrosine-protein phosphatase S [Schistosoma japonicum]|nr:Receptor-type tyrosine-protein phosphatase S [Schistosoma japonicum]
MIWEQNTSVIVMLTKIIENGEVKCDQYWPNHGVLTFSDITVTHLETNELANYVMRSFEIRKDNEHRKIWHLQYTSWPDQEVPTYSTVFLMFLRRVGAITPNDCGPIVVHCSSGTGRTGVYIAISILLERMKTESVIDIFGLVNQLHMQRNYMIETQEQYQFIYTALYESITDGNTEVSALSIVPFDWNRVTLCSIRGVNGSDYINASLIDGYLKKNAYIACQGPMISTVEDFWRMVWEKHSCLIVMLCSVKESGKEKCFTYWPEDKPSRYQFFVVDLTAQYTMSSHILREFKVTDTRDGESRTVRQLQYIRWNEQGLPQTSESLIDLIGHVHKTKEQYNYDGPITVHCRQQRVWMIQTEEQYRFCYTTTLDYLNSFDLCTQPQLLIQTNNNLQMNSPNLKIKMKSSHHLSDKTVLFELDKNYELRNHVVFK